MYDSPTFRESEVSSDIVDMSSGPRFQQRWARKIFWEGADLLKFAHFFRLGGVRTPQIQTPIISSVKKIFRTSGD